MANIVSKILPNSIAEEMEIEVGDKILSINGKAITDIIDYLYAIVDDYLEIEIEKVDGEIWDLEIEKGYDEEIGIEFENPILDSAKSCKNKCVFCFVDQLPENMRESLYFKDDDSRLSFLQGNFVTLTNVSDKEFNRIIDYNISPINVSIHTTNPDLRVKMLKNKTAGSILERLKTLVENRVEVNGQIVLCPGFNDGAELDRTLKDLGELPETLSSIAIVPVGVSDHRDGLETLTPFDEEGSTALIKSVKKWQEYFLKKRGTRFVFLSDEFYIIAKEPLPTFEEYEGFVQIENGVGLMTKFKHEIAYWLSENHGNQNCSRKVTIATGTSAFDFMKEIGEMITASVPEIKFNVHCVKNDFFGHMITVAGLLTGSDLYNNLKELDLGDMLLIPDVMLKAESELFLDDWTISELSEKLGVDIEVAKVEGKDFIDKILNYRGVENE